MATDKDIKTLIADATEGLKNKNSELLGKLKDAKKLMDAFDGVDLKKLQADSEALAKQKKANDKDQGKYKELYEKAQTDHAAELVTINADLASSRTENTTLKKTIALDSAMATHFVDPLLSEAARALHMDQITINDEGAPMVGDITLETHMEAWVATDVGKKFITPENEGGDANGAGDGIAEAVFYDKKSDQYSLTKQAEIANKNPSLHTKLSS